MPTQLTAPVNPQDHAFTVKPIDPSLMPCKSALGDEGMDPNFTRDLPDGTVATKAPLRLAEGEASHHASPDSSAASKPIPDNEVAPQATVASTTAPVPGSYGANDSAAEAEFAASKERADMEYAVQWLRSHPKIHERVVAVLRSYDAKLYQRNSASCVPFWRDVLCDLVGKAGRTTPAPDQQNLDLNSTSTASAHPTTTTTNNNLSSVSHPAVASEQHPTTTTSTTTNVPAVVQNDSMSSDEPEDGDNDDDGFFVIDLARVIVQMAKFRRYLPRIQPHYAMKCNDSIPMIAMISALGGSFDCASKGEFRTILDGGFQTAENIIYAHPCKMINNLISANKRGVYMCTFDNEEELEKLHRLMPKAQAVLRIATDDSQAVCAFSSKFGCPVHQTSALLDRAKELGVNVVGVSFHVGSGNSSFLAYQKAITDARAIFDYGAELGFEMDLLDIGGGFPGSDPPVDPETGKRTLFEDVANFIRPLVDSLFPAPCRVIAEPGRYFAESPYAIAMAIHSKRKLTKRDGTTEFQYYTSDGKYQCFNCMLYDHAVPKVHVLRPDSEAAIRNTTIFGPTCDSIDWILRQQPFPALDIGDWIFVPDFGAYTVAAGSKFNGFCTKRIEYISSLDVFAL